MLSAVGFLDICHTRMVYGTDDGNLMQTTTSRVGIYNNHIHNFLFPGSLFVDEIHTILIPKQDMARVKFYETHTVSVLNNETKA